MRRRRKPRLLCLCALFSVLYLAFGLREKTSLISLGTIIRGDEWSGETTDSKLAVLNALRSYAVEVGASRLIVLVDVESSCVSRPAFLKYAQCHGVETCLDQGVGVPTMDCVLRTLLDLSKTPTIAFINGDIMLFQGFVESVELVTRKYENFFLIGRRHVGDGTPKLETNDIPASLEAVKEHTQTLPLDTGYAIDYFVARCSDMNDIISGFPPFIVGAWRWDNALLAHVYSSAKYTVIDASLTVTSLHQITPTDKDHMHRRGASRNEVLAEKYSGIDFWFGSIAFADIILMRGKQGITCEQQGKFQALLRKAFRSKLIEGFADIADFRDLFDDFAIGLAASDVQTVHSYQAFLGQFEKDRLASHMQTQSSSVFR